MTRRLLAGVGALLLATFAIVAAQTWPQESRVTPFTASYSEMIFKSGDPVPSLISFKTVAVRQDGSYAVLWHLEDPSDKARTVYRKKIVDVTAKKRVVVEPFGESVTTYPLSPKAADSLAIKPSLQCGANTSPAGKLLGFEVVLTEETEALPGIGEMKIKSWMAPGLGCFPMRQEVCVYSQGSETQKTVKSVTNLVLAEPEAWVFDVPSTYVERTPSQAMAEAARRYPNLASCRSCPAGSSVLDEAYFSHRRQ